MSGWDDPRMPTLSGLRRRGYTPEAIRDFCDRIGVAKRDSVVDLALLEYSLRDDGRIQVRNSGFKRDLDGGFTEVKASKLLPSCQTLQ